MAATQARRGGEDRKKKQAARLRFRSLVRSVMFNRIWLMDSGDQKISLNVKKNIAMLVRTQRKVGMLTMAEKSLIRTPHALRSIEERKKLITLLAGLMCFARIPPKVRARLVPVIKFLVLGPGRKIIRAGDPPRTCYFILSGEVEISRKIFDPLTNSYVERVEFINGPGDCFGDIELIEECERLNTFTTINEVEVLVVFDHDFDRILRPVMAMQHWDKKAAFKNLHYFQYLTEDQLLVGCKISLIKQFDPLETIYHEDKGHLSYAHFVISGECMILQCLKMRVKLKKGVKTFELLDVSKDDDVMFQDMSNQEAIRKIREEDMVGNAHAADADIDISSAEDLNDSYPSRKTAMRTMDIKDMEIACGFRKATPGTSQTFLGEEGEEEEDDDNVYEEASEDSEFYRQLEDKMQEILKHGSVNIRRSLAKENVPDVKREVKLDTKARAGARPSQDAVPTRITYENHFIDVGSFTFGGIFGVGEKLEHRVIMARTTVQCLMIPRFWLFEKDQNLSNQWQRRKFYLESTIPSRDSLFRDFLTTRKWQKFKDDLIDTSVSQYGGNPTKVQDIPIFCRIVEAPDE